MNFLDLLFDRRCCVCERHIDKGAVCSECEKELEQLKSIKKKSINIGEHDVEVSFLFDYDNPIVKKLLFALKRRSDSDLFKYASELYFEAVPDDFRGAVINCPRSGKSFRNYGYDQVAVPCRIMCKNSGDRLWYLKILKRRGLSKEQKNLSLAERKENTKNKFVVTKKDIPKNILVVDDVVTTGSTICSCILELIKCRQDVNVKVVCLASRNAFSGKG